MNVIVDGIGFTQPVKARVLPNWIDLLFGKLAFKISARPICEPMASGSAVGVCE